jgi:2-keto-4-pentenoate hydratase
MNRDDGGGRLERAAWLLLDARQRKAWLDALPADAMPQTIEEAHAIADRVAAQLGGRGGWKVGAASPQATPGCAPLAASLIHSSPAKLAVGNFQWIGIEAEIAFKFARDLPAREHPYAQAEVLAAVASVHPAIEIADSRYRDWRARSGLEQAADCGNNGAFILGPASAAPATIDQMTVTAEVSIGSARRIAKTGGNTAGNVQRLLTWLANHCAARGTPLRAGDVVTSGSCTGLEIIPGGQVRAVLAGIGEVSVTL